MRNKLFLLIFLTALNGNAQLSYIVVRDAPDGGGSEVSDFHMTADDSITLYAAGYDTINNFLGNLKANWTLTGSLDGLAIADTVYTYRPVLAPTTGSIVVTIDTI